MATKRPKGPPDTGASHDTASMPGGAWNRLTSPATTSEFYSAWITLLCSGIRSTSAGLLLLADGDTFLPAAVWPWPVDDVSRLAKSAESAISSADLVVFNGTSALRSAVGEAKQSQIALPIVLDGAVAGVLVIEFQNATASELEVARHQMVWGLGWAEAMLRRQRSSNRDDIVTDEANLLAVLDAAGAHDRFDAVAISIANELARQMRAERVSIGMLHRRGVQLAAMSYATRFDKRSDIVKGLEGAMQEAYDQHAPVAYPATAATARRIAVAHQSFSEKWGVGAVVSVLLIASGHPVGVVTLERAPGEVFTDADVHALAVLAGAVGQLVDLRFRQDRWFSGRAIAAARDGLAAVVDRDRPSARIAAVLAVAVAIGIAAYPMTFRISAKAVLEGQVRRVAPAPFDGFVASAAIRAGETVRAGQELARLDDRDLRLEHLKFEMDEQRLVSRQREAAAKHDRSAIAILGAQIEQTRSQLRLVEEKLARTRIVAPIDGVVVAGDLSQMLGAPVTQGKVLFEVAPLSAFRLALHVDERDIGYLAAGQKGQLLLTGLTGRQLDVEVARPAAVAVAEDGRNLFKVEASIAANDLSLRPGMEGIAKIQVGERPLIAIWMRPILDRLTLLIWSWTP